ncbi:uncharacterized protein BXIN_0410 [Babesia sp. Xinjiang]|uniref:uncharacterized protein n=1 Tax=Babesia sp. Xinjiang TaxID=462227 RepID=UPI000A21D98B|nr:uncharacterized protein BXIN_0410 [Babesia sp. Xinjiang]ORM41077.1 hypothetical protein BXIN_0410 [Babesia sp. Xinjiang]
MSRDTGYFRDKYKIGQTIRPEPQIGSVDFPEECYASDVDEADATFVRETFGLTEGTSDAVLCCPGCFTPICYKCKIDTTGNFESTEPVNVTVEPRSKEGAKTTIDEFTGAQLSNKRHAETEKGTDRDYVAYCDECRHAVASVDDNGIYTFRRVIASPP